MNKKIKLALMFCVSALSVLVGFTDVKAATLVQTPIDNVYYTRRGGGKPYMSAQYNTYDMDGKTVYCIEPGVDITTHSYNGATGWINSPYSDEINRKIQLYGYYGYEYPGHHTVRYRMAAQALIWETTGGQIIEYWTEASGWGDYINVDYEKNEIKKLVNAHYQTPSFNNETKSAIIGNAITFTDTSGVLSRYQIHNSDGATSSISGNTLTVVPNKTGEVFVSLVQKSYTSDPTTIFVGVDQKSQKMGLFGLHDPVVASVKLNVVGGRINIKKVDSENDTTTPQGNATLIGAKYNVIDSNGNVVDTLTIGNDSTATSKHLALGTYTIKEVSASTGYYLNNTTYTATITSSDTIYITVEEDVIKGKIKVNKFDSETNSCKAQGNATLIGAKYNILNSNGNVVDTLTIGNDCSATSKELPYGNYIIKEVSAPTGYYLDTNSYSVSIKNNETISITSKEDVIKGKIKINKIDSETKTCKALGQATLIGAKFNIMDHNNNIVDTITIGNDCSAISKYLPYGKYTIKELSAPTGYYLNSNVFETYIYENKNYDITVENDVIKNYISILKQYDYVNGNTTFLNAEANITFEIFYPDGSKYGEITTDKNGYATLDIPYGVWKFHQVNSNTGFEKIYDFFITVDENSELEQYYNILNNKISAYLKVVKRDSETGNIIALANTTFKILNTDTNKYVSQYVGGKVYDKFSTDETGTFTTYLKLEAGNYKLVEIESPTGYLISKDGLSFTIGSDTEYNYTTYGAIVLVDFENTQIKGQVEIFKNGESFVVENGTFKYENISLNGIKFNLYADEDIKSSDGNYLYYNKGDLVEVLTTDNNGYAKSKLLPLGKYYIVEVETKDNYVLDSTKHTFELTEIDNKTAVVYETYKAFNKLEKGTLEFTKTDLTTSDPIPNVEFNIYTDKDELVFSGLTDKDGKIIIKDLFVGKYYIVETNTIDGYVLSDEKVYFEIKENGEVVKANMTNRKITSTLQITKVDEDNNKIAGVKFGIYDLEDNLISEHITDDNGYIEVELEYGKYYFKELATLNHFVITDEKIYFEVVEDKAIIENTITNKVITGTLEFTKVDFSTSDPIPNTLIEIYNAETDEMIFSGRTDEFGKVIIENLEYGKYYILEKECVGYILNEEKMYFEILENGEVVKATMENQKIEMPKTFNTELTSTIIIISTALLGIGLLIYEKKKNK